MDEKNSEMTKRLEQIAYEEDYLCDNILMLLSPIDDIYYTLRLEIKDRGKHRWL